MANTDQAGEPSMEDILASIRKIISDEDENAEAATPPAEEPAPAVATDEADQDRAFEEAETDVFEEAAPAEEPEAEADVFDSIPDEPEMDEAADVFESAPTAEDDDDVLALSEDAIVETGEDEGAEPQAAMITEALSDDLAFDDVEEQAEEPAADEMADMDMDAFAEPDPEPEPEPEPVAAMAEDVPADGTMLSAAANESVAAAFGNLANVMLSGNARTLEDLVKEMLRPMLKGWLDENLPPLVERLVRDEIERVSRAKR